MDKKEATDYWNSFNDGKNMLEVIQFPKEEEKEDIYCSRINHLLTICINNNENFEQLLNELSNNFENIIDSFCKRKNNTLSLLQNIALIFDKTSNQKCLNSKEHIKEVISNKLTVLTEQIDSVSIDIFRQIGIDKQILKDNHKRIIEEMSCFELFKFMQQAKEYEGYDENLMKKALINKICEYNLIKNDETSEKVIETIIDELCKIRWHNNVRNRDVREWML